ncbi:MAG: carbamate kinase [Armatimonadota bacterium]|nr:carbamate kinase [Armatimonadota bacterium]
MAKNPVALIALGGNALIQKGQEGTAEQQLENMKHAMRVIARLARDYRIVITHGNGPQVGNLLLQQESTNEVPTMPLDVIGAMTQGQIGYMIEASLDTALAEAGLDRHFLTVLTFTEVDANDPLFQNPTKPIGPFYTEEEAAKRPYRMVKTDKGYRRVVASPRPVAISQHREIKQLVDNGYIVICTGGGGIPVVREGQSFRGVEAVIDKDLASSRVAGMINADLFIVATDVKGAAINWGKPDQRLLGKVTLDEMKRYFQEGHFPPGSMGPKVDAMISFVESTGNRAIICHLDDIEKAVAGQAGTEVVT